MFASTLRSATHSVLRHSRLASSSRAFHASYARRRPQPDGGLTNILSGGQAPEVQVKTVSQKGIQLSDGSVLPAACVFLGAKVFMWNVPKKLWDGWTQEHFEIFETVIPKPEILLFGTGERVEMLPPHLRQYLNKMGIQVDVMNTRNACSTYNLLAEEGRPVAAAILPLTPQRWPGAPAL